LLANSHGPNPNPSPQREGSATAPASAVGFLPFKGEPALPAGQVRGGLATV